MAALQALAAWPAAVWHVAVAPAWALAAGLLGGAVAVMPLPWRLRLLGVPLMLPLLWPSVPRPAPGQFELVAVDVGQGTAVLVRTRAHLLVFDAGPAWGPGSDAGARVLLPLLRARGERRIDRLMLSHRDTDHTGGAGALLAGLPVGALHTALEPGHPLREAPGGPAHQTCEAGQRWHWDGVDFEVLHPAPGRVDEAAAPARANTVSCVLRVASPQGSVLLTGDIEAAQEATLVQSLGPSLRSDVLLVPHHGSRTSSSEVFLDAVAPRIAVVQAGYRSRYGHPAPAVMRRYGARSIAVVRSDTCGAWTWPAGAHPTLGRCTRGEAPRYWHHRAEP
jgi:competence protein ComEC